MAVAVVQVSECVVQTGNRQYVIEHCYSASYCTESALASHNIYSEGSRNGELLVESIKNVRRGSA